MSGLRRVPFGTWPSPIAAEDVAAAQVGLRHVRSDGTALVWSEVRPSEDRAVVALWRRGEQPRDLTGPGRGSSNTVNGYGGIALAVSPDGTVYACDTADQCLHAVEADTPITPLGDGRWSWSDFDIHADQLVGVRATDLGERAVDNELVRVALDGSGRCEVLFGGTDFVAAPRISHDGTQLAWLTWDHPSMPWDGTRLWLATLTDGGLVDVRCIAGEDGEESLVEPAWSPTGTLHVASDRSGWWTLCRVDADGLTELVALDAEMSGPLWTLGLRTYDFFDDGRIACTWSKDARGHLGVIGIDGEVHEVATPYTAFDSPTVVDGRIAVIAAGPHVGPSIVVVDPTVDGAGEVLRRSSTSEVDPSQVSVGVAISYPTSGGQTAHALWYPPHRHGFAGDEGELPPLVVNCHGGPTSHRTLQLSMSVQFWTSRGFGYVELNHRGSTGYGRAYRDSLRGNWGLHEVDDAVAAVAHLAAEGLADPDRAVIRGLSAGGWATLQAMTTAKAFAAGASSNGVSDGRLLRGNTHKFESRYVDSLIGPLPEAAAIYDERSAVRNAHRLTSPLLIIQGGADEVVDVSHADELVAELRRFGAPYEYELFPEEGHVFSRAENIAAALEMELDFFTRVLALGTGGAS